MTSAANQHAWVIAVDMGYGHQRTAYPLRDLSPDGAVLLANNYAGMPDDDRNIWDRTRRFYELMSNTQRLPVVGNALFNAFDAVQRILRFYPRRDLSGPDWNLKAVYSLIESGWGRDLIDRLRTASPTLPLVTSFFVPAFMAEFFDYPGDIYCIVCDADIARVWAPPHPASSKIRYFAPNERVVERLHLYGVRPENVFLTGYPLPAENIGDGECRILKEDLGRRLANLDPAGKYSERYGTLIREKVGVVPAHSGHPLTILFTIGGAGAQKEIASQLLRSLRDRIRKGTIRVVAAVGIKERPRDYLLHEVADLGLTEHLGGGVDIVFDRTIADYFRQFNLALRTTDVLWTKPSELSFYTALGVPIVMAPPLGSQEHANREWLLRLGSGMLQEDPRYTDEWFFDLLHDGWFAEAAMQGFVEGETLGGLKITRIVQGAGAGSQPARLVQDG